MLLFEKHETKNRLLTPSELETDLEIAKWLKRPVRRYFNDSPFYPWVVPEPLVNQPLVNFDLGFKQ